VQRPILKTRTEIETWRCPKSPRIAAAEEEIPPALDIIIWIIGSPFGFINAALASMGHDEVVDSILLFLVDERVLTGYADGAGVASDADPEPVHWLVPKYGSQPSSFEAINGSL
jgi:hypothetical protein